ncbi:PAS domain-containing protein [Neobacillus jeddahensis]|uniref:PAS domain-containing protein n=1 Tax=Neobacillus jeddahensis TaxID=1461580 RepID=UPI000AA9EC5B|nr:PAS domain-containing protein [Neobacillus jeddahensis]
MNIDLYNLEVLNKIALFFQLFNNMSDLVYLTKVDEDRQFSYILANEPATKFSGLTTQSFGKPLSKVLPLGVYKKIEAKYLLALTTKEPITYEDKFIVPPTLSNLAEMKYAANQVVYWESTITPVINQDGKCTHLLVVVRNITDRKEKE